MSENGYTPINKGDSRRNVVIQYSFVVYIWNVHSTHKNNCSGPLHWDSWEPRTTPESKARVSLLSPNFHRAAFSRIELWINIYDIHITYVPFIKELDYQYISISENVWLYHNPFLQSVSERENLGNPRFFRAAPSGECIWDRQIALCFSLPPAGRAVVCKSYGSRQ